MRRYRTAACRCSSRARRPTWTRRSRSSSSSETIKPRADLAAFLARAREGPAGIFLDFDGTLSEIVAHPDLARALDGAAEAIAALIARTPFSVTIVSGRPSAEIERLLPVEGVRFEGLYGFEGAAAAPGLVAEVESVAVRVPGAWVEDKGASVAVHYREASDPAAARAELEPGLAGVAAAANMEQIEGKMVLELVPRGRPRKGDTVERIAREAEMVAVLYAGDDAADLEAFTALDRLAADGVTTLKVVVEGAETPDELLAAADLAVEGAPALVAILNQFNV